MIPTFLGFPGFGELFSLFYPTLLLFRYAPAICRLLHFLFYASFAFVRMWGLAPRRNGLVIVFSLGITRFIIGQFNHLVNSLNRGGINYVCPARIPGMLGACATIGKSTERLQLRAMMDDCAALSG